ncbi:MAG: hypothetical protein FWC91_04280 [Defluviitaleaceae bacterium]|nr:hypothetical protein [Defluviitaleaceae bacterium]
MSVDEQGKLGGVVTGNDWIELLVSPLGTLTQNETVNYVYAKRVERSIWNY